MISIISRAEEADEFDFKDEGRTGGDYGGVAAHPICVVRRANELHSLPSGHLWDRFLPPLDHLPDPNL